MRNYDIVIVGGSTTGSWFARRMAEKGFSVYVIEKAERENLSTCYDIFHMSSREMRKYGLPIPAKDSKEFAFSFSEGATYSAYGNYPKRTSNEVIGMHKHLYTVSLNDWAMEAGAEFEYGASFKEFIYEDGRIVGVRYTANGEEKELGCRLAADCSGIPSVARRSLPEGYGVETFEITPNDMFYVILRYVEYTDGKPGASYSNGWTYYKTWEAPQVDPNGAILGVGANLSFEYAEEVYQKFIKQIPLREHKIQQIEKGFTPYHRPPYSLVADGFICLGDAACMTKPGSGEGCTSALVEGMIAEDVITPLLKEDGYLTKEKMWSINKRYIEAQGKVFAGMMATFIGALAGNADENDFFFKHDIVFSQKTFSSIDDGVEFTGADFAKMAFYMILGVIGGKLRVSTIKKLLNANKNSDILKAHYSAFPETTEGFEEWCKKADELWGSIGSMSDNLI